MAAAIGLWVLPRTWVLLKASINILLQGVPEGIDIEMLEAAMRAVAGVTDLHNVHVWALSSGKNVMSAHIVVDPAVAGERGVMRSVTELVAHDFGIAHSTIQVEVAGDNVHPANHQHDS